MVVVARRRPRRRDERRGRRASRPRDRRGPLGGWRRPDLRARSPAQGAHGALARPGAGRRALLRPRPGHAQHARLRARDLGHPPLERAGLISIEGEGRSIVATTVRTLENFIGGDWAEATGGDVRQIVSPVTGETLAEVPDASAEDIARAAKAARDAQPKWAALSAWDRAKICHAIADVIDERREDMARELTLEQGKPFVGEAIPDIEE